MFSEQAKEELIKLSSKHPCVKEALEELESYTQDPTKVYYAALTKATLDLAKQINEKSLDTDDPFTKCLIKLLESGDKVFNTLSRGREDVMPAKIVDEAKSKILSKNPGVAV